MIRRTLSWLTASTILIASLAACAPAGSGPQAWIDQPLEGSQFPVGAITITAHASDASGVDRFEFVTGQDSVRQVAAKGERLGEASIAWTPPGPGTYTLKVRAVDRKGKRGEYAQVTIVVGMVAALQNTNQIVITNVECGPGLKVGIDFRASGPKGVLSVEAYSVLVAVDQALKQYASPYPAVVQDTLVIEEPYPDFVDRPHQVGVKAFFPGQASPVYNFAFEPNGRCPGHLAETVTPAVLLTPGIFVTPPTLTVHLTVRQPAHCRAGPSTVYDSIDVLEAGQDLPVVGKNDDASWLVVSRTPGSRRCWVSQVSVDVSGSLTSVPVVAAPPPPVITSTPLPPATLTPTPGVAPDTTPPSIASLSANPLLLTYVSSGCPSAPRTSTVTVTITDDVAVASATITWSDGGNLHTDPMAPAGGNTYQGTVGPYLNAGPQVFHINAADTSGNTAQSGDGSLTVQSCIE